MSKSTDIANINGVAVPTSGASKFQVWYWRDPDHARYLQRQKYKRLKKSVKERSARWIEENKEYHALHVQLNNRIRAMKSKIAIARSIGDSSLEDAYSAACALAKQQKEHLRRAHAAQAWNNLQR